MPILDATKYNVVGMEDLFLHEAIPGHHYQISCSKKTHHYRNSDALDGLELMVKDGLYIQSHSEKS